MGLLEMLKIGAESFARAIATIGMLRGTNIAIVNSDAPGKEEYLSAGVYPDLRKHANETMKKLQVEVKALDATVTGVAVDRLLRMIEEPNFRNEDFYYLLETIESRLYDELATKSVFVLDPKHAELFISDFGATVAQQFPSVTYDIDESIKCLALGRSTASVFHMMRIMEAALRAIHSCLGIATLPMGPDRNWGQVANRIRENIKSRGSNFLEKELFSEMYALLDAVKEAWRNNTMHFDDKKTEEEAELIFLAVRGFMKKVAARMDENGLPLA